MSLVETFILNIIQFVRLIIINYKNNFKNLLLQLLLLLNQTFIAQLLEFSEVEEYALLSEFDGKNFIRTASCKAA